MAEWLDDCVTFDPRAQEAVALVRSAYESHCDASGRQPLGTPRFNAALERRNAKRTTARVNDVPTKVWRGLCLKIS